VTATAGSSSLLGVMFAIGVWVIWPRRSAQAHRAPEPQVHLCVRELGAGNPLGLSKASPIRPQPSHRATRRALSNTHRRRVPVVRSRRQRGAAPFALAGRRREGRSYSAEQGAIRATSTRSCASVELAHAWCS
jgi:hypothetical protein